MKLTELEPQFVRWDASTWPDAEGNRTYREVDTLAEANGIEFVCPKCLHERGLRAGVHSIVCWAPGVPVDGVLPGPGRWEMHGTGYHDLTLVAGSSSILLPSGCGAHFFIQNGEITSPNW